MFAVLPKRSSHTVTHMLKAVVVAEAMAKAKDPAMMKIAEIRVPAMMMAARAVAAAVASLSLFTNQVQRNPHLSMPEICL